MAKNVSLNYALAVSLLKDYDSQNLLISTAADLSSKSIVELSPLLVEAVKIPNEHQAESVVRRLLMARPEWIDAPDQDGNTALIQAAKMNRLDVIDTLLDFGANPQEENESGYNALDVAVDCSGNHRTQEALANVFLERNKFNRRQKSFALAKAANHQNLGAVRALLKKGADFSVEISTGFDDTMMGNALAVAAGQMEDGEPAVVQIVSMMLASKKSKVALNSGWDNVEFGAPLHAAAFNGNEQVMKLLLDAGAWVNPPSDMAEECFKTPLMTAASGLKPESIQILLAAGADATLVDFAGKNAAHHLAEADSWRDDEKDEIEDTAAVVRALLAAGCDLTAKDNGGQSPVDVARKSERELLAGLFDELNGADMKPDARKKMRV